MSSCITRSFLIIIFNFFFLPIGLLLVVIMTVPSPAIHWMTNLDSAQPDLKLSRPALADQRLSKHCSWVKYERRVQIQFLFVEESVKSRWTAVIDACKSATWGSVHRVK
jgi:hypothetical protein